MKDDQYVAIEGLLYKILKKDYKYYTEARDNLWKTSEEDSNDELIEWVKQHGKFVGLVDGMKYS